MERARPETGEEPVVLEPGEKLHVVTRRRFDGDLRRHFAGRVDAVLGALVRLTGYSFVFDSGRNRYDRRPGLRTRVFGLGDSGLVINVLPDDVALERLSYRMNDERQLVITDGGAFTMNITEFDASQ